MFKILHSSLNKVICSIILLLLFTVPSYSKVLIPDILGDDLNNHVIALWELDNFIDVSGNGHDGTATGAIIDTVNKKLNIGSGFGDGDNVFVNFGTLGTLGSNLNDGVTIAYWIKTIDTAANVRIFGVVEELGVNDSAFYITYNRNSSSSGKLEINVAAGGLVLQKVTTSDISIDDGDFHLIIIDIRTSDNTVIVYVNSRSAEALTTSSAQNPTMSDFGEDSYMFALNNRGTDGNYIDANIDGFVILNKLSTPDERIKLYNNGNGKILQRNIVYPRTLGSY